MNEKEFENLAKYFFEVGQLKLVKRSGWWMAGVKDPESVAEHSHRTSIIAFILAKLENFDPTKLCSAGAFHDVLECRILDLHKVSSNYIKVSQETKEKVINDQMERIPAKVRNHVEDIVLNLNDREKKLLKDADYLECAFQAKEYFDSGFKDAWDWIERIEQALQFDSSKKLLETLKKTNSNDWWKGLKQPVNELKPN